MTREELMKALTERQEMQRIIDEAQAVLDKRTDEIKAHMTLKGLDEMTEGPFKVTWKYNKPKMTADVDKMKEAGIWDAFSKPAKPARPFKVT